MQEKITETWLTRKGNPDAPYVALGFALLLIASGIYYFGGEASWMPVSGATVFKEGQYWRLWSALFAHSDFGHLAANAFLFIPLTYLLSAYFGPFLFPLLGILFGGLINYLVILSMPENVWLLGISGVVSWMAATWVTLFLLIDRRDPLKRRFGAVLFLTLLLFVPETVKPEVSYYSHFVGYALGVVVGVSYYRLRKKFYLSAERRELIVEPIYEWESTLPDEEEAARAEPAPPPGL